jgi:hypothetical protein
MSQRGHAGRTLTEAQMSRPRPVEASPSADALATMGPFLQWLEGLEDVRVGLTAAIHLWTALPALRKEHEALSAEVPRLRQQRRDLQAALDAQMEQVMKRQRDGLLVELPPSIMAARGVRA